MRQPNIQIPKCTLNKLHLHITLLIKTKIKHKRFQYKNSNKQLITMKLECKYDIVRL